MANIRLCGRFHHCSAGAGAGLHSNIDVKPLILQATLWLSRYALFKLLRRRLQISYHYYFPLYFMKWNSSGRISRKVVCRKMGSAFSYFRNKTECTGDASVSAFTPLSSSCATFITICPCDRENGASLTFKAVSEEPSASRSNITLSQEVVECSKVLVDSQATATTREVCSLPLSTQGLSCWHSFQASPQQELSAADACSVLQVCSPDVSCAFLLHCYDTYCIAHDQCS